MVDSIYNCKQVTAGEVCGGKVCAECIKNYTSKRLTVDKVKGIPDSKAYICCPTCRLSVPLKGSKVSKDDTADIIRVIMTIKNKEEVSEKDALISTLTVEVEALRQTNEQMKYQLMANGDFNDGMKVKEIVQTFHDMMTPRCPNCKAVYVFYGCNAIMCECGA